MPWNYRQGATITFAREDGGPGPGQKETYRAVDGWKVEIQDQGCVELTNYRREPSIAMVIPWHRVYLIEVLH